MDANLKYTKKVRIPSCLKQECPLVFLVNCSANHALFVAAAADRPFVPCWKSVTLGDVIAVE